jgi:hypothetical protein
MLLANIAGIDKMAVTRRSQTLVLYPALDEMYPYFAADMFQMTNRNEVSFQKS